MLPTPSSDPSLAATDRVRPASHGGGACGSTEFSTTELSATELSSTELSSPGGTHAGANDPLEPIGRKRLEALREAIQNGTYPTKEVVVRGLERLFRDEV